MALPLSELARGQFKSKMVGFTYTRNMHGSSNLNIIRIIKCRTMINENALLGTDPTPERKNVRETESNLMLLLSRAFGRLRRKAVLHAHHRQSWLPVL
jgi:hypothetical protein